MPGANRLYVGRSRQFPFAGGGSRIILGPNTIVNPNGPYGSAPWSLTNLTETTGQLDPFGGSTASLLTDNAVAAPHAFQSNFVQPVGLKARVTIYFKPGTYLGGINISDTAINAVNVTSAGVASIAAGTPFNLLVVTVGGFFKLTYNVNPWPTSNIQISFGNPAGYTGSGQTQTIWGIAVQAST